MPTETTSDIIARNWIEKKIAEMGESGFSFYLMKTDFVDTEFYNRVEEMAGEMGLLYCSECGSEKMFNSTREVVVCPFCGL